MIPFDEAFRLLTEAARPLAAESVDLARARGRVLAEELRADRDFPPTDRSAMDGFALRAADAPRAGAVLRLAGEVRAGQGVGEVRVERGDAVRIMTGAIVPPGADTVVMLERAREDAARCRVTIEEPPTAGQHIRRRGEDVRAGAILLEPGAPIHPAEVAALASVGRTRVRVQRRPVVRVLSTGDEIVEPAATPLEHQLRNSNACTLLAQLEELGLRGDYLGIAGDEREDLEARLARGLDADLLLITGGVSVGKYDLVREALAARGLELLFHKVAVKPGKPILAGRAGRCLVVGLPGNPVSTFVCFAALVAPALRRLMGCRRFHHAEFRAELAAPLRSTAGRRGYHVARLEAGTDGLRAHPLVSRGSGDVLALARANGFVVTPPEAGTFDAGANLPALLWPDFQLR